MTNPAKGTWGKMKPNKIRKRGSLYEAQRKCGEEVGDPAMIGALGSQGERGRTRITRFLASSYKKLTKNSKGLSNCSLSRMSPF